jgi:hypothetical protein
MVELDKTHKLSLSLSLSLFLVLLAPRKLSLSFYCFSAPYVEPRSDKDLGESLREPLLGDLLGN